MDAVLTITNFYPERINKSILVFPHQCLFNFRFEIMLPLGNLRGVYAVKRFKSE